jgi:hypothetical protein
VQVVFATGRLGEADIRIERLRLAGQEYRQLVLHCADFVADIEHIDCPRGEIRRADRRGRDRPALPLTFAYRFGDGNLALALQGSDVMAWSPLVKRLRGWSPGGTVDLKLVADRRAARLDLAVRQLKFADQAGDLAGDGIDVTVRADACRVADDWLWSAQIAWPAGELYLAPWYRRAGMKMSAQGQLTGSALVVDLARLDVDGIGSATAGLRWDRRQGEVAEWGLVTEPLDLATAFQEWLQPWLDRSAVPKVRASGRARFAAAWAHGAWQSFYAGLEDAALVDGTDYLALHGIEAHIPWQRGAGGAAEIAVAGGRLGELPLGGFRIPLQVGDESVSLAGLVVPLLDGHLDIDELVASRAGDAWQGRFTGGLAGLSMPKLSAALKLPRMAGDLSARIPRARYARQVLSFDGDLVIDVFGGRVVASNIKVLDPLRPTQRFVADVAARNLDFGLLTQTFSFGAIQGRFDLDIAGLELAGWRPVRFDARLASSPGEYRRSISRGALRDISALGGAAGAAAVTASPAGFFKSFDYKRIGLGCSLREDVCHADGIEPAGQGYLVVEGAGIPRVQVIGYNRAIDWNLLVSRIQAIIAGKAKAVIE